MSVTQTVHGGGIWAAGGASADSFNRFYAATGTGLSGADPKDPYWTDLAAHGQHPGDRHDYFMSVIQFRYDGDQIRIIGWYQPGPTGGTGHDIKDLQDLDADLGSCSVLVLPTIGGRHLVITSGKDGDAYLLDADAELGHYDGHVDRVTIFPGTPFGPDCDHPEGCPNEGVGSPSYWRTAGGDHVVFLTGHQALAALKITPAGRGDHWIKPFYPGGFWSALRFMAGNMGGSPVVAGFTGSDEDTLLWVAEPIFDGAERAGAVVFNSTATASDSVGPLPHFPALTAVGDYVFVGTNQGFVCYEHRMPAVRLTNITVSPDVVVCGKSVTGMVTLDARPLISSISVDLISGDPGFVTIPAQVTIPADQLSANFTIATSFFPKPFADHVTEIHASYAGDVRSASLTITPSVIAGIIRSLVLSPATVKGGGVSFGYVLAM